ncbi:beta-defensin 110 [Ovis canadensis]|uniref:Beta-defensin n=1 Tax=Ovis aries TaxID=9940 RepID=W5PSU8_SHEEP|nr:TPA_exp: beta defensin OBD111 [Ovis aries]
MKIHLFFFILLFGVTILPARKRFPHYGSVDMRRQCVKGNGRCKNECHVSEVRIAYCLRPGTHCCLQK